MFSGGAAPIIGTTCWGHSTGVTETNVLTFAGRWTGTGTISGSGDAEQIALNDTEYMESDIVNTGSNTVTIQQDKYGDGDATVVKKYKTAATEGGIAGESWATYSTPFASLGYVQVRVEDPV